MGWSAWNLGEDSFGQSVWLLDDLDQPQMQMRAMTMDVPSPGDGDGDGGTNSYTFNGSSYTLPDYGTNLWLECLAISDNVVSGLIHNSAPLVPYTLSSMQSLLWPAWNAEATFYGSGITNFTAFSIPRLGRNMLFLRARSQFAPRIIGAGSSHNAVIRRDGTVWAWGSNGNGQLGDGQWTDSSAPVEVTGLSNIVALSVAPDDSFTLALDSSGNVWSWGANGSGQLGRGDGLFQDENTAALVPGLSNIVAVAGGTGHAIALRSDGTVWAWGGNDYGDLGDGSGTGRDYAALVPGLTNAIGIASGDYHNFALCANGKVWGWGLNEVAELGIGNEDDQPRPILISVLTNAVALSGGYYHSIALLSDGTVKAWGENWLGEIGNISSFTPVPVSGLSNILAIACGGYHNLFLDQSGCLWVWGNDWWDQLGDGGAGSTVPFMLTSVSNVTAIAGGGTSSMISTADGSLYTWGSSYESQATPTLMDLYATYSSDGSGLPDWWELMYFGHLGLNPNADPAGDGWTLLQDYEQGLNPTNFITPPAITGLTATQNTNSTTVTLTWNAEIPTPANYAIYRTDYNYGTWQYGSAQQIGEVTGNLTFFVDNGSVPGGDGNSIYAVDAIYPGGTSPVSGQAYINSITPAALTPAQPLTVQLVRNATGRWQLMFGGLPSGVQTLRLYWNGTAQDITPANLNNGIYQIPDADVVNVLGDTVSVEAIATNGTTSATVQAGMIANDAPYFVDGSQHMKQNLNFLIRGASMSHPLMDTYADYYTSYAGRFNQSSTNFEEFSFLYHDAALDNLWPFTANYFLENFLVDTSRTNADEYPIGTTNFNFQPNFATNIPTPPMLTHSDPYWIFQPNFYAYYYNGIYSTNTADWGVTVSGSNTVATLQSGNNNLFGLSYQVGCEVDFYRFIDPRDGLPLYDCIYQPLAVGGSVTVEYPESGYQIGGYASWCPAPTLNFVNYYFAPLNNPNANTLGLPSVSQQPSPLPIDDSFAVTNQTPAVMFGSVGQPMILGAWAKYSIQGSSPTKYAYLGQYFFTNAFMVDANGNVTTTNTGVVSPYGEFFPMQPGPVALITMTNTDTGMRATGIVQVISLALDANHDGTIDTTFNGADFTTANRPFWFWTDQNFDRLTLDADDNAFYDDDVASNSSDATCPFTPSVSTPDCNYLDGSGHRVIPCARDLQDFTRLWICGITSNLLAALPAGSTVTLNWGDVGNPNPNNPTIDLFAAADADGGIGYLTNSSTAASQVDSLYCPYIGRIGPGTNLQLNASRFVNNWAGNHFIWCGVGNGTGGLNLTIMDAHSNVLAKTTAYIQLVDIKQMYERWTVGEDPNTAPASTAQIATNDLPSGVIWPFRYANPGNANTPYILFVHGWNLETWAKDRFAETAFKRLYWQGYQGRFGEFRWPTGFDFTDSFWSALTDPRNFDNSEYTAWQSAAGLLNKLNDLNAQYPGHVYVLAHSMGNIVTSEALRLAGNNQVVNTYVASQAALPAHDYDATVTTPYLLQFTYTYPTEPLHTLLGNHNYGPDTPNIYGNRLTNNAAAVGRRINFYNQNDFALAAPRWGFDQITKPDNLFNGDYVYGGSPNDPAPWNHFGFATISGTNFFDIVNNVADRYKVMAYAAESRSTALGATSGIATLTGNVDLTRVNNPIWPPDANNYQAHFWHSAEFRGDYWQQQGYWSELLGNDAFNLK